MINYFYDCYTILNKVYSAKTYLKQAISSTIIEEKNRSLTIKTCYGVLERDRELSFYISSLVKKSPKLAIRTILKIAFYAIKYLSKPVYAVTENAVELVKKLGKSGASGFVNAILRKFNMMQFELPEDKISRLVIKYSFPEVFIKEIVKDYKEDRLDSILVPREVKTCVTFFDVDGEEYLKEKGFTFHKTPFFNTFLVDNFKRNLDYDKGVYTFQSIGSVAICEEVEPGEKLLDCCAAPGGKSVKLSKKFKQITALELHPHRVELIKEYANRIHVENITAMQYDSTILNPDFIDKFDAVLCDVPCSGSGVVNENPDIKLKDNIDLDSIVKTQLSILKNASKYVKPNGYIYYSTCSIFAKENLGVINAFMSDIKGFEIVKIDSKLKHESLVGENQFIPDISLGVGFFICKLKRVI